MQQVKMNSTGFQNWHQLLQQWNLRGVIPMSPHVLYFKGLSVKAIRSSASPKGIVEQTSEHSYQNMSTSVRNSAIPSGNDCGLRSGCPLRRCFFFIGTI